MERRRGHQRAAAAVITIITSSRAWCCRHQAVHGGKQAQQLAHDGRRRGCKQHHAAVGVAAAVRRGGRGGCHLAALMCGLCGVNLVAEGQQQVPWVEERDRCLSRQAGTAAAVADAVASPTPLCCALRGQDHHHSLTVRVMGAVSQRLYRCCMGRAAAPQSSCSNRWRRGRHAMLFTRQRGSLCARGGTHKQVTVLMACLHAAIKVVAAQGRAGG